MYRARLTRSTLRKTDCEIVAVKTIKGKNMIGTQLVVFSGHPASSSLMQCMPAL